jgi:predicted murein hydrolase (TIGR00659 family)
MLTDIVAGPVVPLLMTIGVYQFANSISLRTGRHPLCNPVFLSVSFLVAILSITGTPYQWYFEGAQFIDFFLGPAVVALAVPLHRNLEKIWRQPFELLLAIGIGSLTAALTAGAMAKFLQADAATVASIVPKSVTAPVAMGISQALGGIPSLAAVLAILTGMLGASIGPAVLDRLGVTDPLARGLAMGTAAHGQGTARALQESDAAGAFAGLAMGVAALAMAVLMPLLWRIG